VKIHVTDDRIGRYFRRYQLGYRMIAHGARAQTACEWSGLTRDQLVTLRRRWGFDLDERRRGPAPSALHVFFRSKRHQREAALFVSICRIIGVFGIRTGADAVKRLPSVENGELLCEALEAYRAWQPDAKLDFEHAVLLVNGVVHAKDVVVGHCSDCHGAILIDRMGAQHESCDYCREVSTTVDTTELSARKQSDDGVISDQKKTESHGQADHAPEGKGHSGAGDLEDDRDDNPE
jgi:hypothetical protein